MRTRTIIEIHVRRVDQLDSELCLVTDDGSRRTVRRLRSRHETIGHAARCLADHHGLRAVGPDRWVAAHAEVPRAAVA